jgi:hypothetical protein
MKNTRVVISHVFSRQRLLLVGTLLLLSPFFASSQTSSRQAAPAVAPTRPLSTAAAQARRDQLAKIPELLADPDPNQRLANMEAILDTNDSIMIQLALRAAFQSDDVNLRSLAMRAYIASAKELTFDLLVPGTVKSQFDAVQFDPRGKSEFFNTYSYMSLLENVGFKDHLVFQRYSRTDSTGTLFDASHMNDPNVFNVSGDRLTVRVRENWNGICYLDFRPMNDMTLQGTMSCEPGGGRPFPKLMITSPIF